MYAQQKINQDMSNPKVIRVHTSGNIAGGKSTLGKALADKREDVLFFPEDLGVVDKVEGWMHMQVRNADGSFADRYIDLLHAVCHEPNHRSISQVGILVWNMRRERRAYSAGVELSKKLGRDVVVIIERPPHDAGIFVQAFADQFDDFDTTMFYSYMDEAQLMIEELCPTPAKRVYFRTSPEECLRRVIERGRGAEILAYDIAYMEKIHNLHEKMVEQGVYHCIDNEGDLNNALIDFEEFVDDILS